MKATNKILAGFAVLAVMAAAAGFAVNVHGAIVNADTGYQFAGAAPSGHVLCGNGSEYVDAASCGASANYQTMQNNGSSLTQRADLNFDTDFTLSDTNPSTTVALAATISSTAANANLLSGISPASFCQVSGLHCPASGITGVIASSGWIQFPNGLIYEWMPGPTVTEHGVSLNSGSWPLTFPNAIFGATCSTTTGQGAAGTPGDTDIHVMEMSAISTAGWTVRHSVGGVYSQTQTVSCFLTAIGN